MAPDALSMSALTGSRYPHCPYDRHAEGVGHLRMAKAEFVRALERDDPARVPCWYNWFSAELCARYPDALLALERAYPNDFIMVMPGHPTGWQPDARGADEFGVWSAHLADGVGGQRAGSYLDDWDRLDAYLQRYIPTAAAPGRLAHVAAIVAENPDVYIMGHWAYGPFEQMHAIRGMEQLMIDLHLNRQAVVRLGDALLEYWLGLIDGFAAAGVDGIFFTDDWGSQDRLLISPRMWRQVFKPWYRQLFDRCHGHGLHVMLHSCGNVTDIVGDLVDLGLDALNPIQPGAMDAASIVREYGRHLTFCGGIDVQHFLIQSSPAEIEAGIARLLELFGGVHGGYIIAPANSIMPETPLANIQAMCRAMRSLGIRHS